MYRFDTNIFLERASQPTVYTILLNAFYRTGGLDAIFTTSRQFMDTIAQVSSVDPAAQTEAQKQELVHAYGGLKIALHLIYPLISSKPLHESSQTSLIISREKKDTDPDYFEPHNFLVKLRLAALPLLKELWEASWLVPAPLPVTKSIVQTVMELTSGECEESTGESVVEPMIPGQIPAPPRPTGPDENRIRQLLDMGFPRSAAERALTRTHNNVSAATELLLSHPFPLPPDPEPEPSDLPSDAEPPSDPVPPSNEGSTPDNEEMQGTSAAPVSDSSSEQEPPAEPLITQPEGKSAEQWRKELNDARDPLKASIPKQALQLVDEHPSLIFDVYNAFTRPSDGLQEQSIRHLVDDIKSFSPSAHDVQEEPLAMRCRLLALVLVDSPSSVTPEVGSSLMGSLLALLLSSTINFGEQHPIIPKWLASHLLVVEALLNLGEQPRAITLPKENEPIVHETIPSGPLFYESRGIVFDFCLKLLAIPALPRDDFLSVLRLFVLLTRDHHVACQFVQRGAIPLLFRHLQNASVTGSQSYIALILRHVIEDKSTLHHIMKQEVKRFFSQPRTRVVDVGAYVRHCNAMALRNPEIFVDVTQSLCELQRAYHTVHHVTLKSEAAPTEAKLQEKAEGDIVAEMQVDIAVPSAINAASAESLETVVHYLIGELIKTAKGPDPAAINFSKPSTKTSDALNSQTDINPEGPIDANVADDSRDATNEEDQKLYSCFLMQCLTELLFSYDTCKLAFLSYSPKKRSQTTAKDGATKHRTAALNFLLVDLVSYGTVSTQADSDSREQHLLCNGAMSIIVALCVDSSRGSEAKGVSQDLVSVRKFVLEALSRTIKDLSPSENLNFRYGRLLALSDLCHRLLTVRFNATARKPQDETPTHIAKVMLEKNFVSTLTNALAEVDLNYPNVRNLVAAILRPLEHLYVPSQRPFQY